jgi:hypothetical protein
MLYAHEEDGYNSDFSRAYTRKHLTRHIMFPLVLPDHDQLRGQWTHGFEIGVSLDTCVSLFCLATVLLRE